MLKNLSYYAVRVSLLLVLSIAHVSLCVLEVQAAKSVDVEITAQPAGFFAPTDFDAVTITDGKITLTWTPNIFASTTHIRAKVGSYPTSETDGYEVYNGAGNTVDDLSVSLDETAANIYYIAYSVDGFGNHSPNYAEDNTGGVGMTLLAILGLALVLTWISARNHWIYRFMAGIAWLGVAAYWVAPNGIRPSAITAGSDVDRIFLVLFIGAGCACLLLILYTYNTKNNGGVFKVPGFGAIKEGGEDEEEELAPSRRERNNAYARRTQAAINGRVRRGG